MVRLRIYIRREWLSLILAAVLVVLMLDCILGPLGPRDLYNLRHHQALLETKRSQLLARNADLTTNVQRLRSDNRYIEHLIRRELGFARAGEVIYKFGDDSH
ncbi:MAG TPA: septum formation initiator family protein [Candidatus Binataceae bacterium]